MSETGRPVVFVTRGIPARAEELLRKSVDLRVWEHDRLMTPEEVLKAVPGIHGLFLHPPTKVNKALLDAAGPQLKVVATMSVGLEHIDLKECASRKIPVGYTPNVLTDAVAEITVALTLSACRRFKEGFDAVLNGGWGTWDNAQYLCGKEIKDSVIGIVGMGRIGFATAERFKGFKPSRIIYCGNSPKEYAKEINAEFVSFDDLLKNADFVIVCLSVNPGNMGLFNAEAFKKMKNSAIFVNTSRGVVVNQEDLYAALKSGQLYGAALDVTTPEPLPRDSPLLTLPNVIVTPHIGSATERARGAMAELSANNLLAGLKGEPLPSPVPV